MSTEALGGAEQYFRDLLWGLDRRECEVTLFYPRWKPFEAFLSLDVCPEVSTQPIIPIEPSAWGPRAVPFARHVLAARILRRTLRYALAYRAYRRLVAAFSGQQIDVMHVSNGGYPAALSARMACIAAKKSGACSCVLSIANTPTNRIFPQFIEKGIDALVGREVDRFIVVSEHTGKVLREKYALFGRSIVRIYYGTNPEPLSWQTFRRADWLAKMGVAPACRIIGMVARVTPEKGHTVFLHALKKLRESGQRLFCGLVIGGGPTLTEVRGLARDLGIEDLVMFTDRVPHDQVLAYLACCRVMVLPSEIEGLPYAILEAMSLGVPVVASTVGGIPEQIIHGETGFLVAPRNAKELAEAIERLLQDLGLAERMGTNGRLRFERMFTIDRMLAAHVELYSSLTHRVPRKAVGGMVCGA